MTSTAATFEHPTTTLVLTLVAISFRDACHETSSSHAFWVDS